MNGTTSWVLTLTQWMAFAMYGATIVLVLRMAFFFFSSREAANWQTIKYKIGYPVIAFLGIGFALQYAPAWIIKQARLGLPAGVQEANLLADELSKALPPLPNAGAADTPTPAPTIGQGTLVVPTTNIIHQVGIDESLAGIAAQYGISVDVLRSANSHVVNDEVSPGDYLNVPIPITSTPGTPLPTNTAVETSPPQSTATRTPLPTATATPTATMNWADYVPGRGTPPPTPPIATSTPGM